LLTQPKIVIEEPIRTIVTYACALISMLPHSVYRMLENTAIRILHTRLTQSN
jgi:hypothetical protein